MTDRLKPPWEFDNPLCAEIGPYYFFLEDDGFPVSTNDARKVKELCSTCEHQVECAEWGIVKEQHGVWGGLSPRERALIRRRRRTYLTKSQISSFAQE